MEINTTDLKQVPSSFTFNVGEKVVGKYEIIPNYFWTVRKKPNFVHRFFTRILLGWKWTDDKGKS